METSNGMVNLSMLELDIPNDYTESYKAYTHLGGLMGFKEFKEEVHRSIYDENDKYVGPCDIARVYGNW
jgi:hypothetical protein